MDCIFEKEIDKLLDGNLSEQGKSELDNHAKQCPSCREKLLLIKKSDIATKNSPDNFTLTSTKEKSVESLKNKRRIPKLLSAFHRYRPYSYVLGGLIVLFMSFGLLKPLLQNTTKVTLGYNSKNTTIVKTSSYKFFAIPDKIIIRDHGNVKEVDRGDELFVKILDAANRRFSKKLDAYALALPIVYADAAWDKELVVEFTYSTMQETVYKSEINSKDMVGK